MTEMLTFSTDQVAPSRAAVFENQGIPPGRAVRPEVDALCVAAFDLCGEVAAPAGVLLETAVSDFEVVYRGEGRNEPRTPVGDLLGRAQRLALFAVTLGEPISREIRERFQSDDAPLGCMLDSVASAAADRAAELAQGRFCEALSEDGQDASDRGVLRYSPGYCGWHISGQRELFKFLRPERIGISLGDGCLMQPLKSVSGVIISGHKRIHDLPDSYAFCSRCETHGCRTRVRALLGE